MTLQREKELLTELRTMASMDKSEIAEKYKIPIDGAEDYFKIKCTAVLDTIIDGLNDEITFQNQQEHYKGTVVDALVKK